MKLSNGGTKCFNGIIQGSEYKRDDRLIVRLSRQMFIFVEHPKIDRGEEQCRSRVLSEPPERIFGFSCFRSTTPIMVAEFTAAISGIRRSIDLQRPASRDCDVEDNCVYDLLFRYRGYLFSISRPAAKLHGLLSSLKKTTH